VAVWLSRHHVGDRAPVSLLSRLIDLVQQNEITGARLLFLCGHSVSAVTVQAAGQEPRKGDDHKLDGEQSFLQLMPAPTWTKTNRAVWTIRCFDEFSLTGCF
jgi:hypothetical protein